MFGASSELVSVMEFGFKRIWHQLYVIKLTYLFAVSCVYLCSKLQIYSCVLVSNYTGVFLRKLFRMNGLTVRPNCRAAPMVVKPKIYRFNMDSADADMR